ncbi:MAG: hypothetical protein L3J11_03275 [Draconibacterium sp.]|nr:hypothetical protein [Draconibacterium sp.]
MSKLAHQIYVFTLVGITVLAFILLGFYGAGYYFTDLDQRFFHPQNNLFKPSGIIGHGIGILGSSMMIIGVFGYMVRKRFRRFSRIGVLKYWLEFHIFLCTLGPVLVLYHTSFKFGGIVAISFWSMIAVVFSGVIGRFIYLQIPRTIEGREMSLNELNSLKVNWYEELQNQFDLDTNIIELLNDSFNIDPGLFKGSFFSKVYQRIKFENQLIRKIRRELKLRKLSKKGSDRIVKIVRREIILNRRIAWLSTMQDYLRYWHVAHLPLALLLLVIMIVHVIVAVLFGYKWIF